MVDLELDLGDTDRTRAELERMCEQLLANPLIESYEISRRRMSEGRARGSRSSSSPGSNDDRDAALAFERLGAEPVPVWHAEPELPEVGAVVLPGGFSYGDYLRCGAIARFAPVMDAVQQFADEGGLVLGICNGFQVLCEAGLLPGVLRPNESLSFVCRDVALRVERADTPFTSGLEPGAAPHDPGQARRGVLLRRRRAACRARVRTGRSCSATRTTRTARLPTSPGVVNGRAMCSG